MIAYGCREALKLRESDKKRREWRDNDDDVVFAVVVIAVVVAAAGLLQYYNPTVDVPLTFAAQFVCHQGSL